MLLLFILFLIWSIVVLCSKLSLLRIHAHWHGKQTVITQFSTPHNLSPTEFGYIFDRRFGRKEMMGTLTSLARRRILHLQPQAKGPVRDIMITAAAMRPPDYRLDDCEAVLIASVTYSDGGQRSWRKMSSFFSREVGARWQYEHAVVGQLIEKGYLTEKAKHEPCIDRFIKSAIGFGVAWFAFFTVMGNDLSGTGQYARLDSLISVLLLLPMFGVLWLVLYAYLSILSHEIRLSAGTPRFATDRLRSEWRDVVGFRDYLRVVEWHRLKVHPDLKNSALPYCLASGFKVNVLDALYVSPT